MSWVSPPGAVRTFLDGLNDAAAVACPTTCEGEADVPLRAAEGIPESEAPAGLVVGASRESPVILPNEAYSGCGSQDRMTPRL